MNPNQAQALDDEEAGLEEEGLDIDYDAVYGGLDVDVSDIPKSKELQNSYFKIFKDVAKQGIKETLIGAGGAYGDLLELAGLGGENPAETARNSRDFNTLTRMEQPGYKPTFADIVSLSEDSDMPGSFRLPTSKQLRELNDAIGGPGKAETPQGKYMGRASNLYGAGLAFGQVNPLPAAVGGVAGQAVEDSGGGPLLQAAAEIAGMVLTPSGGIKKLVSSGKKEVQQKISDLRNLGYSEEDITLAINAAYKNSKASRIASKGTKTEQSFDNFAENSHRIISNILVSEIPGIEQGTQRVHELASNVYGNVAREGANITITNPRPFLDSARRVVDQLQNTLGRNPEAQSFINRISEAARDSTQQPSAERMMNFYKELNAMGNWLGRDARDRLITQLKNGIKDTFREEGKQGREFAERFERANAGIRKAYQAEEVHDLMQKTMTQDGIDFKRFHKIFDKPDNVHLFNDVLGVTQTNNLNLISRVGSQIKDFDKSWKAANNFRLGTSADTIRGAAAAYYIYHGDWGGLAKVAATKLGTSAIKRIAEKSITDPKFQNILIKGLHAIKVESPKIMKSAYEAMQKNLEEEGIDLDEV